MTRYVTTRSIAYLQNPDGSLRIKMLAPWDGRGQLQTYPLAVRLAVRAQHVLVCTVEESTKIWTARQMGKEVEAAVRDDLLCDRADAMMREDRKRKAQAERDHGLTYSDANQPPWLRTLQKAIEQQPDPAPSDHEMEEDDDRNDR